ncbi:hypothetical protein [Floridanema aerugineum]|uniref:Uncharacterized protein n=1 Tax=Floridaenema aerugineum BLCC-F46 TaxID=3153654 RepID=A0ABV4X8R9_9CYAN
MPKKSDLVIYDVKLRFAATTREGVALSYMKNHPSSKSARDLFVQMMMAYWLPFSLAAEGVEAEALKMAGFEAIGELEKQINLIRRVVLEQETVITAYIEIPQKATHSKNEVAKLSQDTVTLDNEVSDSNLNGNSFIPKKAADLF